MKCRKRKEVRGRKKINKNQGREKRIWETLPLEKEC